MGITLLSPPCGLLPRDGCCLCLCLKDLNWKLAFDAICINKRNKFGARLPKDSPIRSKRTNYSGS